MEAVYSMSPVLRLGLVFVLMLVMIRKTGSIGLSFIAGSLVVCAFFGMSAAGTVSVFAGTMILPDTLVLCLMVSLILIFSTSMESCGQMERMLFQFRGLVRNPEMNLLVFPALIGLLPMPGGAIFSAPMVRELGDDLGLTNERLSLINYWFRHIWEYWWPLYPGILLAITLADLNMIRFIALMSPFSLVAVVSGFVAIVKAITGPAKETHGERGAAMQFLKELFPVLVVIAGGPMIGVVLGAFFANASSSLEAGLIISLTVATGLVWRVNGLMLKDMASIVKSPGVYRLVFMIFSIVVFKKCMESSHAVDLICAEFITMHIPVSVIVCILPFISGLITGISVAFMGISLPILIPLIASSGLSGGIYPSMILIIVSGFCGVLLSPLHLCLILTNQYFSASGLRVYRTLIPLCLLLFLFGVAEFLFVSRS